MFVIRFKPTNTVTQVSLSQGNYNRTFVRTEEPFALHEQPELAELEQRLIPQHDYLEIVEGEITPPASTDAPQGAAEANTGASDEAATGETATDESKSGEPVNPTGAASATDKKKK